jgi:hypothetical protein
MLDKQNIVVESLESPPANKGLEYQIAHEAYLKMVDYLRLTQAKNTLNRMSDYHYLNIPVSNSTEPVRGIDYIAPVVSPGIDYSTAVITKCLMPQGRVNFEFERLSENDVPGSMQAAKMALHFINSKNDSYQIIRDWAQDSLLHKTGVVMISPVREPITQYKEVEGTRDQLRSFEIMAAEKGLVAKRQQMRRIDVDLQGVMQESMAPDEAEAQQEPSAEEIQESIRNNTIYRAKYKMTGYSTNIQIKHVAQHYFVCNPTIPGIRKQDFCGFYDPMTIHEAKSQYPYIDLEKFADHAAYGPAGAYQAGALENDLALHARDSTPVPGQGVIASAGADRYSRVVMITTAWLRRDIDNDGEEETVEICYSGSYILYVKEVDFIPLATMCPKPIVGNFFGYSQAERLVPLQEYKTAINRAEIAFAMQASTPRIGVNPEFVDAEEIQRGVSALFILDRKFDPAKHVYEFQAMQGNLAYVQDSMDRFDADNSRMLGMTNPGDTMNPEVMKDGNSGYKLQLAMGPNQLIQDEMVKNCATGLRDMIYIVWKTMVQYADDYNIQQLADAMLPGQPFLDAKSMERFDFLDRNMINIDLALGFLSDENRLTRQQLIMQAQQTFAGIVAQLDPSVPELFAKARRPFEDTLYALGVKNCDSYLPTLEEAAKMAQAKAAQGPGVAEQEIQSKVELNKAKVQESGSVTALNIKKAEDVDMDNYFEMQAMKRGKLSAVEID